MTVKFNSDEIYEIAERIEKNGANFYRKAAENFDNESAKTTLQGLASMEEEHRIIFAAMRAEISEQEKEQTLYDPDDDVKKYLRAIADGHVFDMQTDPSSKLTGSETFEEVVQIAIGLEKDSIIFYLGMKDMVPEALGKDKLDHIIAEEKRHIVTLTEML